MTDANKNIGKLVGGNGNVVAKYEYSPFGKVTVQSGSYAEVNPFRFSSEYFDVETGLVYYNYRYYSPELGRWTKRDHIEEEGGLNLYGMASNNPIRNYDVLGQAWYDWVPIVSGIVSFQRQEGERSEDYANFGLTKRDCPCPNDGVSEEACRKKIDAESNKNISKLFGVTGKLGVDATGVAIAGAISKYGAEQGIKKAAMSGGILAVAGIADGAISAAASITTGININNASNEAKKNIVIAASSKNSRRRLVDPLPCSVSTYCSETKPVVIDNLKIIVKLQIVSLLLYNNLWQSSTRREIQKSRILLRH